MNNMVTCVYSDPMMPLDPFENDPNDPASFIEDDEQVTPLTPEERKETLHTLALVRECKRFLPRHNLRGIVEMCENCSEPHYYDWHMLEEMLEARLATRLEPMHEPSMQPNPESYVAWEYAMGFLDGMEFG